MELEVGKAPHVRGGKEWLVCGKELGGGELGLKMSCKGDYDTTEWSGVGATW